MLYTGDGVYCKFCSHEGAKICWKCEEILKSVPEEIYKKISNMTPQELLDLQNHLKIPLSQKKSKVTWWKFWR